MSNGDELVRPSNVSTAVKLLYTTIGLGIIRSIIELSRHPEEISVGYILFTTVLVFGIMWFLIYKIGNGRNWARITFLVLFVVGTPFSIVPMIRSLAHEPISGVLGLVQVVIQVIALIILFQGNSSAWFKAMKTRERIQ